ncbi:MAG: MBL fold metallo-hydrolase [candidate division Zixibacteria bacterium]|nr:MBL fold metallo-hydrolase [candidate division Zixibacteria bacterium]
MADLAAFEDRNHNRLHVSWLGHSSLMINIDGHRVLTDPVLENSVSWVGPSRFNGDVPVDITDLPLIDLVIISHDHYDHLNKFTIQNVHPKVARFVTPIGVGALLRDWGVPDYKIVELDWWDELEIDSTLTISATPAQHFSGRGLTNRNKTLWASFVITSNSYRVFFGGDSGYFDGFKTIGEKYGPFDMTFLECGAYNKLWSEIHMHPEQTLQAHLDLRGNVLHPIHWGTFTLAPHPWYEPMQRLTAAAAEAGVTVATPIAGGATNYAGDIPTAAWWETSLATKQSDPVRARATQ